MMHQSHQQSLSGLTSPCGQSGMHILTKLSKSGMRYFYTGSETLVSVMGGGQALVATTSLFEGNAHRFPDPGTAIAYRDTLNRQGIGGAAWKLGQFGHYSKPKAKRK
ncbi:MAG: hypothetical protein K5905_22840 [Roseibium sp.]|uniref:hypothetical protein n=1 Tax=Roseibium sp. TaxID=1936156 RepID=UPI002618E5D1|nr:hypothetical protein [Roseibium sp.]MCV0428304.1 hypothetical protein [Roseibium sp.]